MYAEQNDKKYGLLRLWSIAALFCIYLHLPFAFSNGSPAFVLPLPHVFLLLYIKLGNMFISKQTKRYACTQLISVVHRFIPYSSCNPSTSKHTYEVGLPCSLVLHLLVISSCRFSSFFHLSSFSFLLFNCIFLGLCLYVIVNTIDALTLLLKAPKPTCLFQCYLIGWGLRRISDNRWTQ